MTRRPSMPPRLRVLYDAMTEYSLSQRLVSRTANVSQAHISNLFAGKHTPSDAVLTKLERAVCALVARINRRTAALTRGR